MKYLPVAAIVCLGLLAVGLSGLWSQTPSDGPSEVIGFALVVGVLIGLAVSSGSAVLAVREIRAHLREVPAGGPEADYHDIPEPHLIPADAPRFRRGSTDSG